MLFRLIIVSFLLLFSVAQAADKENTVSHETVETELKPLVSALTMLNIKVVGSCIGHPQPEIGNTYPWVKLDLVTNQTQALFKKMTDLIGKMALEQVGNEGISQLNSLFQQYSHARTEALYPLQQLLVEFYNTHPAPYDRMLVLTPQIFHLNIGKEKAELNTDFYTLHSQGARFQSLRSPEEQAEKLHEYQMEILFFSQFLVNRLTEKQ